MCLGGKRLARRLGRGLERLSILAPGLTGALASLRGPRGCSDLLLGEPHTGAQGDGARELIAITGVRDWIDYTESSN